MFVNLDKRALSLWNVLFVNNLFVAVQLLFKRTPCLFMKQIHVIWVRGCVCMCTRVYICLWLNDETKCSDVWWYSHAGLSKHRFFFNFPIVWNEQWKIIMLKCASVNRLCGMWLNIISVFGNCVVYCYNIVQCSHKKWYEI